MTVVLMDRREALAHIATVVMFVVVIAGGQIRSQHIHETIMDSMELIEVNEQRLDNIEKAVLKLQQASG